MLVASRRFNVRRRYHHDFHMKLVPIRGDIIRENTNGREGIAAAHRWTRSKTEFENKQHNQNEARRTEL